MRSHPRILLTTFGSFGDLHPFIAVALELKRRGCEPVIGTSAAYREKIESAGIEFASIRPDMPSKDKAREVMRRAMDKHTGTQVVIRELMIGNLRDSYEDTVKASKGVDAIVSHALTYSSPIVAEQFSIPWAYVGLQPVIFFSAYDPSVFPEAPWLRNLKHLGPKFFRGLMDLGFSRLAHWADPIADLRRELGLPKSLKNPIYLGQYSPFLNLALFSKALAAPQPDWPAHTVQTGFAFYDHYDKSQQPMTKELKRFLDSGDPPVVFTLGTAAVRDAGRFYHESVLATRKLGLRAVLLTGAETGNDIGLNLEKEEIAVPYAPYSELLPRALVNVHQGGVGTTGQAMRAGKPMLIMPYAHDQPDNAARLTRLGVARNISRSRYNGNSASVEISRLVADNSYVNNAEQVARIVDAESGAACAADALVCLLHK